MRQAHEDNEYAEATDEQLEELLASRAPEIVESALVELTNRNPRRAAEHARRLMDSASDELLRASALSTLWSCDRERAWQYIDSHSSDCAVPLLVTIVEEL